MQTLRNLKDAAKDAAYNVTWSYRRIPDLTGRGELPEQRNRARPCTRPRRFPVPAPTRRLRRIYN